jgi:hypothetical protein
MHVIGFCYGVELHSLGGARFQMGAVASICLFMTRTEQSLGKISCHNPGRLSQFRDTYSLVTSESFLQWSLGQWMGLVILLGE